MEYIPFGPLKRYIPKNIGLPLEVLKVYAAQLVVFLEYLHSELEVCHRDLKPGNIMIDENLYLKIVSNKFKLSHKSQIQTSLLTQNLSLLNYIDWLWWQQSAV